MEVEGEAGKAEPKAPVLDEVELSDEDRALKEKLEGFVTEVLEGPADGQLEALTEIRTSICASTSTMTSVPKPLKFLLPFYGKIKEAHAAIADGKTKAVASDVVSLLAMTQEGGRDCLHYRFTGSDAAIDTWGHEYVRHLAGQIAEEYTERTTAEEPKPVDDIMALVQEIIPYNMKHNAESEACDLAMETDRIDLLEEHVDAKAYSRVCLYLTSCVPYVPEPHDTTLKKCCLGIFRKFEKWPQAMQMALKLNDPEIIEDVFMSAGDKHVRRQLAFMLGRQQVVMDLEELLDEKEEEEEIDILTQNMRNTRLSHSFLRLARELDIMEPKSPEDVYKTHLEAAGRSSANVESARANLAATYVNAFINAGFGQDKLLLKETTKTKWIHRNKGSGQLAAAASLGMLLMWDIDAGINKIDPYLVSEHDEIQAGALLAIGMVCASVADDADPARAILAEPKINFHVHKTQIMRSACCMGLALSHAGTADEEIGAKVLEAFVDPKSTMEVRGVAAISLGQIYVATADGEVTEAMCTMLSEMSEKDLASPYAKMVALGLGLLYLGRQMDADIAMESLVTCKSEAFIKVAKTVLETCAYAGTGNVLKVQSLLHACSEHVDPDAEGFKEGDNDFQAFATIGVALVAMGEDVGTDMVLRTFNHLLRYGEPPIRRAVPLAIALLCVSNPKLSVLDTLSKLSHDADSQTVYNAILAMGLVGGGTNHARIAAKLRMLAQYYNKDANALFMVRIAQGIVHAGKGSISLSPFHTDRSLMSNVAVSGLLPVLVAALNMESVILKDGHYMLYNLALAMYPRILCTFEDSEDEPKSINIPVRVGQAVDVVGQAGNPNTITGFITNNTPVLMGHGERAQLATDEYIPVTPLLEGFVIVKKNPDYEE